MRVSLVAFSSESSQHSPGCLEFWACFLKFHQLVCTLPGVCFLFRISNLNSTCRNLPGLHKSRNQKELYAQTLILVNLILLNLFIENGHNSAPRPQNWKKISGNDPTGLPEPPRQPRTLYNSQKVEENEISIFFSLTEVYFLGFSWRSKRGL